MWESFNSQLSKIPNLSYNDNNTNDSGFYKKINTDVKYWYTLLHLGCFKHCINNNETFQQITDLLSIDTWHPNLNIRYNIIQV